MFVDASILIAFLAGEPDAGRFAAKLESAKLRYTSSVAVLEAVARLSALLDLDACEVEASLQALCDEAGISVVPISGGVGRKAVAAFGAYGFGGAHPAQLDLAACLTHACATSYRVAILSRNEGFARTDAQIA